MTYFDPWKLLCEAGDLATATAPLPDGEYGRYYHEHRVILLSSRLGQAARRSTLSHELVHAERGDLPGVTPWHDLKQEYAVERAAAMRLISFESLLDALRWSREESELADVLWVDAKTLRARLAALTDAESCQLRSQLRSIEAAA